MDLENIKLITLSNGSKWIEVAQTIYNNETYKYLLEVNAEEDDITDNVKFVSEYDDNGKTMIRDVNDTNILRIIIPLLVPETNEYFNNPNKLEELIAEN